MSPPPAQAMKATRVDGRAAMGQANRSFQNFTCQASYYSLLYRWGEGGRIPPSPEFLPSFKQNSTQDRKSVV